MASDHTKLLLQSYTEAYRIAFETAVRTGTALIQLSTEGKVEHFYPPFKYVMIPKDSGPAAESSHEQPCE